MQKPHSRHLQLCKVLPAAALTLLASGIAADAVIEAQTLEVKELLEVIEVIDVTAEKEIDESSTQAPDPEVAAILEQAVREETETPAQEE